jgi:hypothetical protein
MPFNIINSELYSNSGVSDSWVNVVDLKGVLEVNLVEVKWRDMEFGTYCVSRHFGFHLLS